MNHSHLASRIRSHRKKAGLNQKELAGILDLHKAQVSRHERAGIEPPLVVVLSYEAVFGVPVRDLYPRLYADVSQGVEERLATMEAELQQMPCAISAKESWMGHVFSLPSITTLSLNSSPCAMALLINHSSGI